MKILYAAQNNTNARIQLSRFLKAMQGSQHQIKVAAYKNSSPRDVSVDWTLDCLLNLYKPEILSLENDNLQIYYEQLKYYAPDLVISDLEYFTGYLANLLNISVWQCSSTLINYGLARDEKYNLGVFKYYAHALHRDERHRQRLTNLLDNSNGNFIYSHFGDTPQPPQLQDGFQWVRPYHQVGKSATPCQHHVVAGLSGSSKTVLKELRKYPDSVAFTDFSQESYHNVLVKDIRNQEEYFCNLKNSPLFVCQGQTSFLADAFYNSKYSLIYPDYQDPEAILNGCVSSHLGLSSTIDLTEDLDVYADRTVEPMYDTNIQYLHEKVNDL
jgi:uncharacterized protein (TIGR00661 family)